ncbi:hypothetical protein GCM10010495_49620 [Kitasatospora herbaricolor]|nr:hypothetical protein GCM10010495_49620 [Kitasatospora herbaricolor]
MARQQFHQGRALRRAPGRIGGRRPLPGTREGRAERPYRHERGGLRSGVDGPAVHRSGAPAANGPAPCAGAARTPLHAQGRGRRPTTGAVLSTAPVCCLTPPASPLPCAR